MLIKAIDNVYIGNRYITKKTIINTDELTKKEKAIFNKNCKMSFEKVEVSKDILDLELEVAKEKVEKKEVAKSKKIEKSKEEDGESPL